MRVPLKAYLALLVTYLRPQRGRVVLMAVLLLGGIGLQLASPQVIRAFVDATQSGAGTETLAAAAALYIGFAVGARVVGLVADYAADNVAWSATNALRADLTRHCLRLDLSFHKQRTPGELIERIDGDVTGLANFFSHFVIRAVGSAVLVAGVLVLLFREDARVGAGLTLYTLITVAALAAIQNFAVARWAAERQADAELFGFLEERITGTEDIRACGGEPYVMNRLYALMRGTLERNRAARLASNVTSAVTSFLFVTGYAVGLALGAYLYTQGQATIGTAYVIVYYIGMLSGPIDAIRAQMQDLQRASAGIGRVLELLSIEPRLRAVARAGASLPAGPLSASFAGVSFVYDDLAPGPGVPEAEARGMVLHDVSFELQPGRVLGVLGRTGSGKSTLSRLLSRLYDPLAGSVRLGGSDLRQVPESDLRERVGMVTQDVQLFQAALRDNLTFFGEAVSEQRVEQALRALGMWDWVQSLPQGLDTRLAGGGQGLSAGEAQLLAFARVFLRDPSLVILDEASSRLDPATESRLERAMDRLFQGRTGIVIAHRLRTVQRADDILVLEGGRVVEFGPRERLAADPSSRFYRLLQTGLEEALA